MLRYLKILLGAVLALVVNSVSGFTLLGPAAAYQTAVIGYVLPLDMGTPQALGEEYRWNIKTLYYGFDSSFLNAFGQRGVDEVNKCFKILNAVPAASQMSPTLSEFSLDTRRVNYEALALGVWDMKSAALSAMLMELGLHAPERWAWALRDRTTPTPTTTNYFVIMRNYDPVTYAPTPYVNGTLYTYIILEPANPSDPANPQSDAVELPVDPLAFTSTAVAGIAWDSFPQSGLSTGDFLTGITRDDAGGLRYMYRPDNYNIETVVTNSGSNTTSFMSAWTPVGTSNTVVNPGSPWTPVGTNTTSTNALTLITTALRPGVDKITFIPVPFDSVFGTFVQVTNTVTDTYVTNSSLKTQTIQRILASPDIIFTAEDTYPVDWRSSPPTFTDNAALNSVAALNGPGSISGQIVITFNKLGPLFNNVNPGSLDEATATQNPVWGAFDGTTNALFVFPSFGTVHQLEQRVLGQ